MNLSLTNTISPCKECKTRYVGCHGKCNQYINWRNEFNSNKEIINNEKNKYKQITSYEVSRANKIRSRY